MTDDQRVLECLGLAYRATVLHTATLKEALAKFEEYAADPDFVAAARREATRLHAVHEQCFMSKTGANFLNRALELVAK